MPERLLNCRARANQDPVCKLSGLAPEICATSHARTAHRILAAKTKALAQIASQCGDSADVAALALCDPDQTSGPDAAACEVRIHSERPTILIRWHRTT